MSARILRLILMALGLASAGLAQERRPLSVDDEVESKPATPTSGSEGARR